MLLAIYLQEFQWESKRTAFLWPRNFKLPCTPNIDLFAGGNKTKKQITLFKCEMKE